MHNYRFHSRDYRIAGAKGRGRSSSNSPGEPTQERNYSELGRASLSGNLPSCNYPQEEKPIVNLQYVLTIENKLWQILGSLRQGLANKQLCQEYWEISGESPVPLLEPLFREERTRKVLRHSCVLEVTALALANFCFGGDLPPDILQQFRNLLYYVHQNYLSCMKLLLFRIGENCSNNNWVDYMKEAVRLKQVAVPRRGNQSGFMNQHCAVARKIIQDLGALTAGPLQHFVDSIPYSLDHWSYRKVRVFLDSVVGDIPESPEPTEEALRLVSAAPYLPAKGPEDSEFTLVLDLDETLVHYLDAGEHSQLMVRPGCGEFIEGLAQYYELVVFTAALEDYADWAINLIDPHRHIKHRFYRQHTIPTGPVFVKDLRRLGRDLKKVIIVDNVADNFRAQPDNGIFIKSWFDDETDNCLEEIAGLLRELAVKRVQDVRVALRSFRDQVLRQLVKGVSNPLANFRTTK